MAHSQTRRRFLAWMGASALTTLASGPQVRGEDDATPRGAQDPQPADASFEPIARVAIARDGKLAGDEIGGQRELIRKLLDAALQKLTGEAEAPAAWRKVFSLNQRIAIKVNALGLTTRPVVVEALAAALQNAGVSAENILVWDRFDVELAAAGFKLNKTERGVRCRGTDADRYGAGYLREVSVSGQIGSCYSRILAEECDALISVPVLKDHNLAGVSLGIKNFYGAIHNPNKYHENNCDPFAADIVSHPLIRAKWKLTVIDATGAQYHAGPGRHPGYGWPYGGLIVGTDFVAVDAVGADLIDVRRREAGLKSLEEDGRPARHIQTAGLRGLGVADLERIQRIEV